MKYLNEVKRTYEEVIKETADKLTKVKRQIYHTGSIRLFLFLAGIAGLIYFWSAGWAVIALVAALTFLPFLILIKVHNRMFYKRDYLEKKIEINNQELKAINYDISDFDGGSEYIDPSHLYTYDLDVFGSTSLFQYINRTSTQLGKVRLAAWFNKHLQSKEEIVKRQEAITELAPELKFRQRFRILGLLYKGKRADEEEIKEWAATPNYYRDKAIFRALPYLVLLINAGTLALAIADIIPFTIFALAFVSIALLSSLFSRNISRIQAMYGKKMQILATYSGLISLIEEKQAKSTAVNEIKALIGTEKQAASLKVKRLTKLLNALDQRNNMLMFFLLNGLMLWDLKQTMSIEAWKEEYAAELPKWMEAIGLMDAYCSLATFAYNHPGYVYPAIEEKPFTVKAKNMGHPLMNRDKCVRNDIDIHKRPFFIIITGANMAGKSTYLRTVGVNNLLALLGTPVYADEMSVYPAKLVTSLRTSDSLADNESYFFAELKRLKLIIDKLKNGEELFIILDEILKGTNSTDKQKGSLALISQFIELSANGIIATHDLLLGKLINEYPDNIQNYRFEADIIDNELSFSYQMKEGVAQNMNACFLMKKMGIAVIDD